MTRPSLSSLFFFNDTATTEIYTLSLHDALPIFMKARTLVVISSMPFHVPGSGPPTTLYSISGSAQLSERKSACSRSEEHTSELQSPDHLVCRLLLEKKKKKPNNRHSHRARYRNL